MTATLPRCAAHPRHPLYDTRSAAEAALADRRTTTTLAGSPPPRLAPRRCGRQGWHVMDPGDTPIGNLTTSVGCRALADALHHHDNDWRVDAAYVDATTDVPCEVCQVFGRVGQVQLGWSPRETASAATAAVCSDCVREYLSGVVLVEAGDRDVHVALIDVVVRRALR